MWRSEQKSCASTPTVASTPPDRKARMRFVLLTAGGRARLFLRRSTLWTACAFRRACSRARVARRRGLREASSWALSRLGPEPHRPAMHLVPPRSCAQAGMRPGVARTSGAWCSRHCPQTPKAHVHAVGGAYRRPASVWGNSVQRSTPPCAASTYGIVVQHMKTACCSNSGSVKAARVAAIRDLTKAAITALEESVHYR